MTPYRSHCLHYHRLVLASTVETQQQRVHHLVSRTFAVDLKVDNDGFHGTLAVPPEPFACLPPHLSHEELPDTPWHWSCPEELVLEHKQTGKSQKENNMYTSAGMDRIYHHIFLSNIFFSCSLSQSQLCGVSLRQPEVMFCDVISMRRCPCCGRNMLHMNADWDEPHVFTSLTQSNVTGCMNIARFIYDETAAVQPCEVDEECVY